MGDVVVDERLVELLVEAEDRLAQGRPATAEQLCPDAPSSGRGSGVCSKDWDG